MSAASDRVAAQRLLPPGRSLPALDMLGRMAAKLLGTPSAQVSLLTDVQTVTGGAGLGPGAVGSQGPLADSLCTVTAAERRPLVVEDAAADLRVSGLPPVTAGVVGAYLGVPLVVGSTAIIGALCVFDEHPRAWSEADVRLLEQLAQWAVAELELAALGDEQQRTRARWQLAIDAAGIGSFDYDLVTGQLEWDDRMLELFGYERAAFPGTIEAFDARLHRDDLQRVTQAIEDAVAGRSDYDVEYRVVVPGGPVRWLRARGRVLGDEGGRPVRMVGAALDTTEAREADLRLSRALEAMSAGVVAMGRDWRVTYVNAAAERILGMPRGQMLGEDHWELFPGTIGTVWEETYRRVADTREAATLEARYGPPVDQWLDMRVSPVPDGVILSFLDVTARHEAEELVEVSTSVAARLTGAIDVDAAVADLARLVVPRLADWSIVTLVGAGGTSHALSSWHRDPELRDAVARYSRLRLETTDGVGGAEQAMTTREPVVIERDAMAVAREHGGDPAVLELLEELAPESTAVLPLDAHGRLQGLLILCRGAGRPALNPEELSVARSVAGRAALALDSARSYAAERETATRLRLANQRLLRVAEHERTVAQALQEAMLTRLPEPDHLHLVARYLTASADEQVGGDWYDALVLPSGATTLVIGDVVGHDIGAAAMMGQLRNMLRTLAWDRDEPPSAIVARLDRAMHDLRLDTLATLLMARIEQGDADREAGVRTLRWTSAGHPAPLLLRSDGTTALLDRRTDVLLGIAPEAVRRDHVQTVEPEATLLLYTDGLVETRTRDVVAGQRRLGEVLRTHGDLDPEALLDAVIGDMVGDAPDDDVAVLAVRLHDERRPRPAEAGPEHL